MNKVMIFLVAAVVSLSACSMPEGTVKQEAASGVQQASVKVQAGSDGMTAEQRNVRDRVVNDNRVGAIKHLYLISAYSGQVILYSTVKGKVTSSGKRLTPTSVSTACDRTWCGGMETQIGNHTYNTSEVLQDDGTYGSSVEYVYWWDTKGNYHQQYITGGMILHISDVPLAVKSVTIRVDQAADEK